jgi:predicted nucleotidyltransferase
MSVELQELAESLRVNERTLRRAWALGTLRGERVTPYKLRLPVDERVYLRRHWPTISRLRAALRTEPNVSLAVLFGSVARGDDDEQSDVDLLVGLRDPGLSNRVALARRLRKHIDLPLEVIALEDTLRRPSLMVEILRDGRVLVDRDGRWVELSAQGPSFEAQARERSQMIARRAQKAIEMFAKRGSATRVLLGNRRRPRPLFRAARDRRRPIRS